MEYREFIDQVQAKGRLASFEEAEEATLAVMRALAEVVCRERAASMQACLPAELFCLLERCRPEADPLVDSQTFIGWTSACVDAVGMLDKTLGGMDLFAVDAGEEAVRRCGCVFCVLKSCMDESLHEALARELPEEVCDWFRAA
ncbi:MAG: DUF2267 domain-containing protein [Dehalococcoidia bacterium]